MSPCPRRIEDGRGEEDDPWVTAPNGRVLCSYCGSLNPDAFMMLAAMGVELGPTDKNYKIYVDFEGGTAGKFYFQHLSEDQRRKFVDLLNRRVLNLGTPGHFYVAPFFVQFGSTS